MEVDNYIQRKRKPAELHFDVELGVVVFGVRMG